MENNSSLSVKEAAIGILILAIVCVILWPLVMRLLIFAFALTVVFVILATVVFMGKGIYNLIYAVSAEVNNDSKKESS